MRLLEFLEELSEKANVVIAFPFKGENVEDRFQMLSTISASTERNGRL